MKRKPCRECPHIVESQHNKRFKKYVEKITNDGVHGCHMVDPKNIWGEQTEKTKCIGKLYKQFLNDEQKVR
jgi:hypothetical protein